MKDRRLFALLNVTFAISACGGDVAGVSGSAGPSGSSVVSGNGGSGNTTPIATGGSTNGAGNAASTGGTLGPSAMGGWSGAGGAATSGAAAAGGNGPCLPENVCTPTTCGSLVDACGNIVDCGYTNCAQSICGASDPNTGIATPNVCPWCTTTDCATAGKNCGILSDGCGGIIDCGTCTAPECCGCASPGSTAVANVCGAGSVTRPLPSCIISTKGCLCDSMGGCAAGLTCDTTKSPNLCCSGTDCTPSSATTGVPSCAGTGVAQCTPGITIPAAIANTDNCGYPTTSFNENAFMCGIYATGGGATPARIQGFFNDELPLTLGCATTTYPVSTMTTATLGDLFYPQLGDPSCMDTSGHPMRPTLFITDITADPNCRAGDQQAGGVPYDPIAVFGTWTYADTTGTPVSQSSIPMNYWTLGTGADSVPAFVQAQCPCSGPGDACPGSGRSGKGYGAEVLFEAALMSGHSYRLQFMAHDGDPTQGGDSGEACVTFCPGSGPCNPLTCADYPPTALGPQSDGCNGVTESCHP